MDMSINPGVGNQWWSLTRSIGALLAEGIRLGTMGICSHGNLNVQQEEDRWHQPTASMPPPREWGACQIGTPIKHPIGASTVTGWTALK
jgi:hypothetical protein